MWSHSPSTLHPGLALGTACISSLSLPAYVSELLTLYCSVKFQCGYIWSRHIDDAKKAGITDGQLKALQARDIRDRQVWEEKDVALLAFVDAVIDHPEANDSTFLEARKWFNDRQIVEIITAQGFYYMWARVATTLRVEIDGPVEGDYEMAKNWAT